MKNAPLDWLLLVVCGLLLLGHGGHSAATTSMRDLCTKPNLVLPGVLRTYCRYYFNNEATHFARRAPTPQVERTVRRLDDDEDLEPLEPPAVFGRQERFLQEPTAWETIKRQDNNHMFLRFGRRRK